MMVTIVFVQMSRAIASGKRIAEVLDEEIDITDKPSSAYADKKVSEGSIEFRNVSFRYYKNSEEKVLDAINLYIPPKSTVGIIGSTGCGKTTLVSMIPRLYDCDEGEVLVDGVNVRDYSLYNLREGVGMVLQKNVLFSGTIEDNLRWGNENATQEEIQQASEHAQAHKFVSSFPKGYQTDLGRAVPMFPADRTALMYCKSTFEETENYYFDDSTSAVDTAIAQIRKAFRSELAVSTKIIIAQRITSVMEADMIVVMNEGRITGVGTHEQLLLGNTEYQEIYYSQMDKEKEA